MEGSLRGPGQETERRDTGREAEGRRKGRGASRVV